MSTRSGFTLIEVMLSLLVSAMVISVIYFILMTAQNNFITLSSEQTTIENAETAINIMTNDIRNATAIEPYLNGVTLHYQDINHSYFVDNSSLYLENNSKKTELVSGIDAMNIQYVVQENNQLMELSENDISDWDKVVALNITYTIANKRWFNYVALRQTA